MDETYRDVYNMSLKERKILHLVAEGSLNEGELGSSCLDLNGKSIRYVDKGFTQDNQS